MLRRLLKSLLLLSTALLAPDCLRAQDAGLASSALKDFIAGPKEGYRYEIKDRGTISKSHWLRIHLVSQRWHETDWKHVVWVIAPNSWIEATKSEKAIAGQNDSALMLISGGGWQEAWGENAPEGLQPNAELKIMATVAETTRCPTVVLSQVPFQPMLNNLKEDALISETFRRFLLGQGNDWPLLMPMVRSASRAMDAVQTIAKEEWDHEVRRFTVTGASKRGWTTWLTSAVDPRVDACAPMVIDMLNMPVQMKHQIDTWGKYSEQIADYTDLELPKYLNTPGGVALQQIVDPFRYRKSLTQPKLLIFGTNDRYWPLDACSMYWKDLEAPKYLLYVPNQPHGIADYPRLVGGLCALHRSRTGADKLPKLDWSIDPKAGKFALAMTSDLKPTKVELWQAKSATRDFRDSEWTSTDIVAISPLEHGVSIAPPTEGFIAFFGDWTFTLEGGMPYHLTTNVRILGKD